MTPLSVVQVVGLCLSFLIGPVQTVSAELTPEQIAILANSKSPDSLAVARHYATRRGVPPDHIFQLDLPLNETISRDRYERTLILPLRQLLETRRLAAKVRVLVTTYGMPLRVQAPRPTDQEHRWRKDAAEHQRFARAYLEKIPRWANRIAVGDARPGASDRSTPQDTPSGPRSDPHQALLERLNTAVRDAADRIQRARDRESPEKIGAWNTELARLSVQAGGMAALVRNLHESSGAHTEQGRGELTRIKQTVAQSEGMIQVLSEAPSDTNRARAYQLAERVFGLQGILRLATTEVESFSYQAGDASLDSELSLLWWDSDMYRIAGRILNPLHYDRAISAGTPTTSLPILMVSRLDGPTPDLAKRLVEQAIETEQRGLSGRVYVDAQGRKPEEPFGYGYYDQDLRDLADLFRRQTTYPVALDNTERRFSQPGEAPDVAVYVGWYKLRSYEDAFTFRTGAIGYHIASAEAISIHDPREPGWCKNALERGITATLGSTGEPYLDAFPLPNEFFALLLSGRYSLVEAYALTSRYASWRMVLFGDPLYNPWRRKNLISDLSGLLRSSASGHARFPSSPSARALVDPIKARQDLKEARRTTLSQVSDVLQQLDRRPQSPR